MNELYDIIKGDEIRISKILEKYNVCEGLTMQLTNALEKLETNCIKYGLSMNVSGKLLEGEKKEFQDLKRKYFELEERYEKSAKTYRKKVVENADLKRRIKKMKEKKTCGIK